MTPLQILVTVIYAVPALIVAMGWLNVITDRQEDNLDPYFDFIGSLFLIFFPFLNAIVALALLSNVWKDVVWLYHQHRKQKG